MLILFSDALCLKDSLTCIVKAVHSNHFGFSKCCDGLCVALGAFVALVNTLKVGVRLCFEIVRLLLSRRRKPCCVLLNVQETTA
eukprot:scaffold54_cov158-Amphora_coffeaeformis.AAC.11